MLDTGLRVQAERAALFDSDHAFCSFINLALGATMPSSETQSESYL